MAGLLFCQILSGDRGNCHAERELQELKSPQVASSTICSTQRWMLHRVLSYFASDETLVLVHEYGRTSSHVDAFTPTSLLRSMQVSNTGTASDYSWKARVSYNALLSRLSVAQVLGDSGTAKLSCDRFAFIRGSGDKSNSINAHRRAQMRRKVSVFGQIRVGRVSALCRGTLAHHDASVLITRMRALHESWLWARSEIF
jgi:hypothetical protein